MAKPAEGARARPVLSLVAAPSPPAGLRYPKTEATMEQARAGRSAGIWALTILLAAVFLAAGVPKLLGLDPPILQAAAMRGFPEWVRLLVGLVETVAAILLLVPAFSAFAAGGLALLMLPATITQLISGEPGAWVP